jgi:hypothetical protein
LPKQIKQVTANDHWVKNNKAKCIKIIANQPETISKIGGSFNDD